MVYNLFLDVDVVIDFLTDREPHAHPASEIFEFDSFITPLHFLKTKENNTD
jgi:hypothetical protein